MQPTPRLTPHRDNIFGICNALGQDFGFNPIYPRLVLAMMLLVSPVAMLVTYGVAGLVVLASHLLIRPRRAGKPDAASALSWSPTIAATTTGPRAEADRVREPIAA